MISGQVKGFSKQNQIPVGKEAGRLVFDSFTSWESIKKFPLFIKNSPAINKTEVSNINTITIIMLPLPIEQKHSDIVIVGGDSSLHYLLQRYAGQIGYPVRVAESPVSAESIRQSEPVAVIFPSVEILESTQALVVELTNCDIPIIVCSSVFDEAKTFELGADYCLLHPLVFDNFSSTLQTAVTSQRENRAGKGEGQETPSINPV